MKKIILLLSIFFIFDCSQGQSNSNSKNNNQDQETEEETENNNQDQETEEETDQDQENTETQIEEVFPEIIDESQSITLFKDEPVGYFGKVGKVEEKPNGVVRYGTGKNIIKKFKLPKLAKYGRIYLHFKYRSAGDPYDRPGSIFAFKDSPTNVGIATGEIKKPEDGTYYFGMPKEDKTLYSPPVELLRFMTPFGIGFYTDKFRADALTEKDAVLTEKEELLKTKEADLQVLKEAFEKVQEEARAEDADSEEETDADSEEETDADAEEETDADAEEETDADAEEETDADAEEETDADADAEEETDAEEVEIKTPEQEAYETAQAEYDRLENEIKNIKESEEGIDVRRPIQLYRWKDYAEYRVEVSQLENILSDEVYVGVHIGGGWDPKLTWEVLELSLEYEVPEIVSTPEKFNITNLINTVRMVYDFEPPFRFDKNEYEYEFTLSEDYPDAKLYYTSTGHGGYNEGDEFNKRPNEIYIDGQKVIEFTPWREDGFKFRDLNPASGTWIEKQLSSFYGDEGREKKELEQLITSSDFNRSGWMPGSAVLPEVIELGDLPAGKHKIKINIIGAQAPSIKNEDGSSVCCNEWLVSAYITGRKVLF